MRRAKAVLCAVVLLAFSASFAPSVLASTAATVDIVGMSVSELQTAVDSGQLDYETITTLYLERIEAYGDMYECVITLNDDALELARARDAEFEAAGRVRSSELFGMPIVVKDNIDVGGMPTTAGSKALADNMPCESADIVKALEDAGAVVLAKTNMDEFAFNASRSRSDYGTVKNAYNLEYTAYGSSGGSAVGVASSLAPLALGTDTNSSIRLPAAGNGVVGLRPTVELLSGEGIIHYDITRDTAGVLALGVYDSALALSVMTGEDYTKDLAGATLEGVVVGVSRELCYEQTIDEPIAALLAEAVETMRSAGATIVEVEGVGTSYQRYLQNRLQAGWTIKGSFDEYLLGTSGTVRSFAQLCELEPDVGVTEYLEAADDYRADSRLANIETQRGLIRAEYEAVLDKYDVDVLIYPSMRNAVELVGFEEVLRNNSALLAPFSGMPAITVPMGLDENGLPSGLEFFGRANDEAALLQIALAYENARGEIPLTALAKPLYDAEAEAARQAEKLESERLKEAERAAAEAWRQAKEKFLPAALTCSAIVGLAVTIALTRMNKKAAEAAQKDSDKE